MEYKNHKIYITLCEPHKFSKVMMLCCLTKANSRLLLFISLLTLLLIAWESLQKIRTKFYEVVGHLWVDSNL